MLVCCQARQEIFERIVMERELWKVLTAAIAAVETRFVDAPEFTHPTAQVVRVYLWAALHERSVNWACKPAHWPACSRQRRKGALPDQSTMSRRTGKHASDHFHHFLDALGRELSAHPDPRLLDLKRLDGKPLLVASHSKDPDATWGRGSGGKAKGYKLHGLWGTSVLPESFCVAPLNVDERKIAKRLLRNLSGHGYVLADGNYDASELYVLAGQGGYQLVVPRDTPGAGLGHRRQRRERLRAIELLERGAFGLGAFGPSMFSARRDIETRFGNLCGGVGALTMGLPPFIRRIWRVRAWVKAKLLIYAARVINNTQQNATAA